MKRPALLVLGCLLSLQLAGREVEIRLWISGGTQDLLLGNRETPGWLSVARQIALEDPEACWIHLGSPPVDPQLLRVEGLAFPDVLIPTEADFRLQGLERMEKSDLPYTLLNTGLLPQFPEKENPFPAERRWRQVDGVTLRVFGLLSESAPLTIPASRLRPLSVRPPLEALRSLLTDLPVEADQFPVLALGEGQNAAEVSKRFPDIPLLLLPAASSAKVIEVRGGTQLRVQPERFGRRILRVHVYWDTVTRKFRNPKAETVWVPSPDLQGVDLPEALLPRIRPRQSMPERKLGDQLLQHADAVLLPEFSPLNIDSKLPDALRASRVPADHAWMKLWIPREVWAAWKHIPSHTALENADLASEVEVLIPARTAAGGGDWHNPVYQWLRRHSELSPEWMDFTTRDMIVPVDRNP